MMRRSVNIILAVVMICSLILITQQGILAQAKSKQKPQRKVQKAKEAKAKVDTKSKKMQISGADRYRAIVENNLFMPLGSTDEVKRKEYILTGIMGNSAFIQMEGSGESFFVTEGQLFGNDAKIVQIGSDSVTIVHEGNEKELKLASGALTGKSGSAKGGRGGQRQNNSGKNRKGAKTVSQVGKKNRGGPEKQKVGKGDDDGQWARKMSIGELSKVRDDISRYIAGLERKGVTDPGEYEGAFKKMEMVEQAIAEKGE